MLITASQTLSDMKEFLLYFLPLIAIIAIIYLMYVLRKISKAASKTNALLDDLIYKAELLNAPIEVTRKLFNYIDTFELLIKKNTKSGIKILQRNSDLLYKVLDKIKTMSKDIDLDSIVKPNAKKGD